MNFVDFEITVLEFMGVKMSLIVTLACIEHYSFIKRSED